MPTAPPPALDRAAEDALYPCSDGEPMAEDMWQSWAMMTAAGDLGVALPEALVALDILMYPEEGNPNNRISPDVLVALGLGTHNRMSYLVWREGKPPDWVLEVASHSTVEHELDAKRHIYAAIGVPEYWQFDPRGDLFPPSPAAARPNVGQRRVPALAGAVRGRRADHPQPRAGAGLACGWRVRPLPPSGDQRGCSPPQRGRGAGPTTGSTRAAHDRARAAGLGRRAGAYRGVGGCLGASACLFER